MEAQLPSEIQHQLDGMVRQLVDEFNPIVPREEIEHRARHKLQEFGKPRVVAFLPILVYRYVRDDLVRKAG